jgi:glucose-1-phosphate cytidylyltransferase
MKAVILAGGLGTRISEETSVRPKPMVEIGGKPILWHILKIYSHYGIHDFIICCGYKGYMIKEYFANYSLHTSDVTFNMRDNSMEVHARKAEPWRVTLVDTGDSTLTGGRLRRVREHIGEETFCFTYGDGVADIDLQALIALHQVEGRQATLTAVQPPGRFGSLAFEGNSKVVAFDEKPRGENSWINGGFFVLEPSVIDLIDGDQCTWEQQPLKNLAETGDLSAYRHHGFWQPMDTLRDKTLLEDLWLQGKAPWKLWS